MLLYDTPERWLPVVGYEGWYEVSDLGRVRRVMPGKRTRPGLILTPFPGGPKSSRGRYMYVQFSRDNTPKKFRVHVLVMAAFVGPVPEGCEVNHANGVKADCRFENLEYTTRKGNTDHAVAHGLKARGESSGVSKLTDDAVRSIRALGGTMSQTALGALFGVSQGTVSLVLMRKIWTHII